MLKLSLFFLIVAIAGGLVAITGIGGVGSDVAWLVFSVSTIAFFMTLARQSNRPSV